MTIFDKMLAMTHTMSGFIKLTSSGSDSVGLCAISDGQGTVVQLSPEEAIKLAELLMEWVALSIAELNKVARDGNL